MQEAQLNPVDRKAPSANATLSSAGTIGLGLLNRNVSTSPSETAFGSQSRIG